MVITSRTWLKLLLLPLALCVACSGQAPDSEAPSAAQVSMFTGRLDTADSVVGLAVSAKGDVEAYVCGGATTFATNSRWFVGSLTSNAASLETDGFRLDVALRGETTDLTLTAPGGAVHKAVADRAGTGSRSAVFESPADAACRWGVVMVDDGGAQPDVFGTWCGRVASTTETTDVFAQVTPVQPIDFSNPYMPVQVSTDAGEQVFKVHRVSPGQAAP